MKSASLVLTFAMIVGCGARTDLDPPGEETGEGGGNGEPEICNGLDDDADGQVDEGLGTISCGIGACERTVDACADGRPAECIPGMGGPESCNGVDDDCNGAVDDGLGFGRIAGPSTVDVSLNYLAYASIQPTPSGFMFAYGTGFDGSNPQVNAFFGELDQNGSPLRTKVPLTDRNMPNGLRLSPDDGGLFAAFCGRYGFEDQAATGFLAYDGGFKDFGVRPPSDNHCGAGTPDGISTGEGRHLFAWTDNSTMSTILDVGDGSGASIGSTVLSEEQGDLYSHPRFAMTAGVVLVTYSIIRDGQFLLRVHKLDALGNEIGETLELPPPVVGSNWMDAQIVGSSSGFLLVGRGWNGERYDARFDTKGELVQGPDLVPQGILSQHALASDGGGGYVLVEQFYDDSAETVISRLDGAGQRTDAWFGSTDAGWSGEFAGWPAIASGSGRIVLLYTSVASGVPDHPELRVITLGCQPSGDG